MAEGNNSAGHVFMLNDTKKVVQWTDGFLLSRTDIIRMSFSGVTMISSTCTNYACGGGNQPWFRVQTGSLNDYTFDVPYLSCSASGPQWFDDPAGPTIRVGSNSSCTTSDSTVAASMLLWHTGALANKILFTIGYSLASGRHRMFEAVIDPCDLESGMVLDNFYTAGGCNNDPLGVMSNTYAFGGTMTVERICA